MHKLSFSGSGSLWILEEGGGQNREYVRCRTGVEVHATVGYVDRPSTSCAPLQIHRLFNPFYEPAHTLERLLSNSGQCRKEIKTSSRRAGKDNGDKTGRLIGSKRLRPYRLASWKNIGELARFDNSQNIKRTHTSVRGE